MRSPKLMKTARMLRRDATEAERKLWRAIRGDAVGARFRRQHPIPPYVADFACIEARLVVEIDGGQHGGERDVTRDAVMTTAGWRVQRYWNNEVMANFDGVVQDIARILRERLGR